MGYIFIFIVQYQLWKILKINNKQKTNVISLCKCFNMEINYLVLNQILNKDIQHKNRLNIENIQRPRFKCIWSYSDQKRLEGLVNWKNRELNQFDDFRPIF